MSNRLTILVAALALGVAAPTTHAAPKRADYFVCLAQAEQGCYPLDANGNPRPPDFGDPVEEAAYRTCYLEASERCEGLPGDPNG